MNVRVRIALAIMIGLALFAAGMAARKVLAFGLPTSDF
jgi:hypothetical protein